MWVVKCSHTCFKMSRIGKQSIAVNEGVKVSISKGNEVTVTGPKGTLQLQVSPELTLSQDANMLKVERPTDQKRHRAMHGPVPFAPFEHGPGSHGGISEGVGDYWSGNACRSEAGSTGNGGRILSSHLLCTP